MPEDPSLKTTFNQEARLYHQIRPHYPEPLFDDLVIAADLQPASRLLEIGPGTGQATEPLARRGYRITAVELGSDLAQAAKEALKTYPNVRVLTGGFEEVQLPLTTFDLVYAATAFHWIKPEARFKKPYDLLNENGSLAVIETVHISDEVGDEFFFASQPIYKKYGLDDLKEGFRPPRTAELAPKPVEDALFTRCFFKAYRMVVRYSADEFAKLLRTYSPTIAMPPQLREGFLRELSNLIGEKFGGSLDKHFAMTLMVARKK
jgi:SAM-dependent methyltransferase